MRVPRLLCPAFPDRGPARLGAPEAQELERLVEWLGRTKGTNDNDRQ